MNILEVLDPDLVKHIAICGVAAWGVVEGVKPLIKSHTSRWATLAVRLSAIALGAAFGFSINHTVEGAVAGAVGGALSATTVASLRRFLARKDKS